jgi:MoaA/NifB/PqqE/SkfB family radical SAM enzyme
MDRALFRSNDYVEVAVHFRCNLRCVHCMIEGTMDWLRPQSDEELDNILAVNARDRKWKGLTLTGAEVTLRPDLPVLARRARDSGFEHVRIQTHGARLADPDCCRTLVDAGVNEFFVSITAADAATHDSITGVQGSFERTLRGLENLDGYAKVVTLTNTVVTKRSYHHLPEVVSVLANLRRLAQMEFWAYWPMRESDDLDLIVNHVEALPYLREAIERARVLGRRVEVKNFPECLLGDFGEALDNGQPHLVIDPEFWVQFMRNGFHQCAHRSYCGSKRCLGLNTAYVNKFGWQADLLVPLPKEH